MIDGTQTFFIALPFCRTEHQMVTMRTQMTVKTSSARTPPITAYGTALVVSTTALGSEGEEKKERKRNATDVRCAEGPWAGWRDIWGDKCKRRERGETLRVQSMSRVGDKIRGKEREKRTFGIPSSREEHRKCDRRRVKAVASVRLSIIGVHQSHGAKHQASWCEREKEGEMRQMRLNKEISTALK